jgi:hypothetical protein
MHCSRTAAKHVVGLKLQQQELQAHLVGQDLLNLCNTQSFRGHLHGPMHCMDQCGYTGVV